MDGAYDAAEAEVATSSMGQCQLRQRRAIRRRTRRREGRTVRQLLRRELRRQRRTFCVILALHHRDVLVVVIREGHRAHAAPWGRQWG